ncbi:phenylacetic acid degradation protein PaaN [Paraburkholderia sediminicola]|uniref:phenylacetic acid degradation protein PaaN n=1 Tax=Paraburkholderia sediminicola TaxID=458836 RepID=UPI0038B746CA
MSHTFFAKHESTLSKALNAIQTRGYWSLFNEMPSPRAYGETAAGDGEAAFKATLNSYFEIGQPGTEGEVGKEVSPFGLQLSIKYPRANLETLLDAASAALKDWRRAGPQAWVGISLEIIERLNASSFEIAHSVMHTTGQAFMMAFQAGGPHAQDRALEAVAYAWNQLKDIPATAYWEKPQGNGSPLTMEKHFSVVPRGIGLVIGCCTFPTWNSYPGLFADLATGNVVVVKPHPAAILPLAITVRIARKVLSEAGFDPNIVTLLATDPGDGDFMQKLVVRPDVKIIDFTGSTSNGAWIEEHARQAQIYTEKAGVNQIVIDSVEDMKIVARNIAFSLSLYSGQMCTAPQNIYVPRDGIPTANGRISFDEVAASLRDAVETLLGDPAKAVELTGAIQNVGILERIESARALGKLVLDSKVLTHPLFPDAVVRTPLIAKLDVSDAATYLNEWFGPVSFIVATDSTHHSLALASRTAASKGALTLSVYSTDKSVIDEAIEASIDGQVALSINLTGGVFVNQSAAFSDFHATGGNPAANASLTDPAFVANRFRVVQRRQHIAQRAQVPV